MEIWILGRAAEKLEILQSIENKKNGILLGHRRGSSFIVEDLIPLKEISLNSKEFASSLLSNKDFIGFFSSEEKDFENLPQYLFGNIILKTLEGKIKGYYVELDDENSSKIKDLSVLILRGENE